MVLSDDKTLGKIEQSGLVNLRGHNFLRVEPEQKVEVAIA
jgi:hypothetical protein